MAGLVPAIPIDMARSCLLNRDRRDKPGDDESEQAGHAVVPPLPKLVPPCNTPSTSFGSERGTSNSMILVPLYELKFLNEIAASGVGTSTRRHLVAACGREVQAFPKLL